MALEKKTAVKYLFNGIIYLSIYYCVKLSITMLMLLVIIINK